MTKPFDPVYPVIERIGSNLVKSGRGLTKREWFAGLAMQGQLSNPESWGRPDEKIAEWSRTMADALIVELGKHES